MGKKDEPTEKIPMQAMEYAAYLRLSRTGLGTCLYSSRSSIQQMKSRYSKKMPSAYY